MEHHAGDGDGCLISKASPCVLADLAAAMATEKLSAGIGNFRDELRSRSKMAEDLEVLGDAGQVAVDSLTRVAVFRPRAPLLRHRAGNTSHVLLDSRNFGGPASRDHAARVW